MQSILTMILQSLNFAPGLKTKIAAIAAFGLALVAAYNGFAPSVGLGVLAVPDWANAIVLALLGVGAANQPANLLKQPTST